MSTSEFNEEHLPDLLPLYYKRLFPHQPFCRWLSYALQHLPEEKYPLPFSVIFTSVFNRSIPMKTL
ncbi:hypothetical protein NQ317_013034 [Molorchus minor]|uniref:Uncharacterized protein n=1 Tax=Molorchus minor TaxID=1323400 RepID=A0ABQ9K4P5_9CUCU|nr:hypothetical protein NQ317_013034 [Molorchus minor]